MPKFGSSIQVPYEIYENKGPGNGKKWAFAAFQGSASNLESVNIF